MMTSKPEDRLRKKGVKTRKYYKWLRWSMKKLIIHNPKDINSSLDLIFLKTMTIPAIIIIIDKASGKSSMLLIENEIPRSNQRPKAMIPIPILLTSFNYDYT